MVTSDYPDTAVTNICTNDFNSNNRILWTFSTHLKIVGHHFNNDNSEIFANYATLPIGMFSIRECPHDPSK